MSMNLIHQQEQQDDFHNGMIPSLMSQQQPPQQHQHNYHQQLNNDYCQNQQLDLSSCMRQLPSTSTTHHYNDQDQYPSFEEFNAIVQDYLLNLSSKKRDKALIDQARYAIILQVLKDPRNTAVSTAQFRFWVKKMFQLTSRQIVCHDGKPVAMREQIYGILVRAHREAHHGGRDKTSSLVRRRYSWIPKELIARFVRRCPFCISRRNGNQQSPLSLGIFLPATPPTYSLMPPNSIEGQDSRIRPPSMMTSTSSASSSNASYPEEIMLMAAAAAHHSQQQQQQDCSSSSYGSIDFSTRQQQQQQPSNQPTYYAAGNYYNSKNSNSYDYYSRQHPSYSYSMTYNQIEEKQPMMMQPPLSVYYATATQDEWEYGLKQNPTTTNYSVLDSSHQHNFVAPNQPPPNLSRIYATATTVMPSPLLSPSSSSTSATSSPVHPAYHENADHTYRLQHLERQQQQQQQQQGLNLLSHHQSLF